MEGRTTLIVAHRLSTIGLADRVVLLDRGHDRRRGDARRTAGDDRRCTSRCSPRPRTIERLRGRGRRWTDELRRRRDVRRWRRRRTTGAGSALGGVARRRVCRSAGIPSEMQEGVNKLLAEEPDHGEPAARFQPDPTAQEASARAESGAHALPPLAVSAIAAITARDDRLVRHPGRPGADRDRDQQGDVAGPRELRRDRRAGVAIFLLRSASPPSPSVPQTKVTGRLAARVMNDLRSQGLHPSAAPRPRLLHR